MVPEPRHRRLPSGWWPSEGTGAFYGGALGDKIVETVQPRVGS